MVSPHRAGLRDCGHDEECRWNRKKSDEHQLGLLKRGVVLVASLPMANATAPSLVVRADDTAPRDGFANGRRTQVRGRRGTAGEVGDGLEVLPARHDDAGGMKNRTISLAAPGLL